MNKYMTKRNLPTAVGAALLGSLAVSTNTQATENPFGITELNGGYMQMAMKEGKCGEGKCGGNMKTDEGKCGGDMKAKEGKCGGDMKTKEGKCGTGK